MKLTKLHWIGMVLGIIIIAVSLIFFLNNSKNLFLFLLGIGLLVIFMPFLLDLALESKKDEEMNAMFLEFSRNLAESVNMGTPVSKSIVNMSNKNYGVLSPNIKKLANQIELGIPLHKALTNFAGDVGSVVVGRAVALIMEAERAGGDINYILESVATSIAEIEKIKKERKSAIYSLVVQGYIIFFVFVGIMLIMQFKILPLTSGLSEIGSVNINSLTSSAANEAAKANAMPIEGIANQFLYLLIAQGFFAGLIIGKLGEGSIKAGIKHSFILMITSFLIATGARALLS